MLMPPHACACPAAVRATKQLRPPPGFSASAGPTTTLPARARLLAMWGDNGRWGYGRDASWWQQGKGSYGYDKGKGKGKGGKAQGQSYGAPYGWGKGNGGGDRRQPSTPEAIACIRSAIQEQQCLAQMAHLLPTMTEQGPAMPAPHA